jgi:ABC-type branched-subunit amino acid transport system permease subunit
MGVSDYLDIVVCGTIAILVTLLMPKGVWGEIARRWELYLT